MPEIQVRIVGLFLDGETLSADTTEPADSALGALFGAAAKSGRWRGRVDVHGRGREGGGSSTVSVSGGGFVGGGG